MTYTRLRYSIELMHVNSHRIYYTKNQSNTGLTRCVLLLEQSYKCPAQTHYIFHAQVLYQSGRHVHAAHIGFASRVEAYFIHMSCIGRSGCPLRRQGREIIYNVPKYVKDM